MSIDNIRHVKIGRNAYRDKKHTTLLYMTYFLRFPDGDEWVKQQAFSAHDLSFELNKIMKEHWGSASGNSWYTRCQDLWDRGETWWKDEAGIETHIKIEKTKRKDKWGIKSGYIDVKHNLTEEQFLKGTSLENKPKGDN